MQSKYLISIGTISAACLLATALAGISGCGISTAGSTITGVTTSATQPAPGQTVFDSDVAAAAALVAAAKESDRATIDKMFGPAVKELMSGDPVEDKNGFDKFAQHAAEHTQLEKKDANTTVLDIGNDNFPFPIPIVRTAAGKWFFDTAAGKQEILARKIGANELETISVCHAYVEAQRAYASEDRDGSGVLKYAQCAFSHAGKHDGLYWPAAAGEEQSPFGQLVAQADTEGYVHQQGQGPQPFHGYYYHILTKQGPAAPGGKYNYVINGNMIAGFAAIAYPAEYGQGGIMTFIISHQGKLYQKDLGPDTLKIAHDISAYNPDTTWTLVKD